MPNRCTQIADTNNLDSFAIDLIGDLNSTYDYVIDLKDVRESVFVFSCCCCCCCCCF